MRCTEAGGSAGALGVGLLLLFGGCSQPTPPPAAAAPAASPVVPDRVTATEPTPSASAGPASRQGTRARNASLPPPRPVASWDELRRQAARRIVEANPDGTYLGAVAEPLLAIPVLEVELKRDGSIARIVVLRAPRQAKDTSALAIAAVHRAAPFGDVSRLPRPWRFTETFLFNDERKFKPRTLDD